jgi:hypothetical protein
MNFIEAYQKMLEGHKVQSIDWLSHDFIYIEDDQLRSDSGFPYASMLGINDLEGQWQLYNPIKILLQEEEVKDVLSCLKMVVDRFEFKEPQESKRIYKLCERIIDQYERELSE